MNPEITLDDYKTIGTMETALSEHADEAFFELSDEGQKIAGKIFKCLTETDRENREIRRATTIEKLCAVSEADFGEVAAVIEVFRREGRTFLMPPPEVPLNENSLIDISHESLIRKWERLKKWVEEEGQSARTYRRLAEDALLHRQNKMGFWSDPELKDALEWRENFKPNETWAQFYKETGERQFKASFADSMRYLEESELNRDEEIAEDTRQQNALRSFAAKLRWAVIGLLILFMASLGVAGYAFYLRAEAVRINSQLIVEKNNADDYGRRLQDAATNLNLKRLEQDVTLNNLNEKKSELESKQEELSESLKKQEAATKEAKDEKIRADEQTRQAQLSEEEKRKALVVQERLAVEAKAAKVFAEERQKEAEKALKVAQFTTSRVEINRSALVFLEQGEYKRALAKFEELLKHYEDERATMSKESYNDGKWWTLHNLGIVYSKLPNTFPNKFINAECSYNKALNVLGENQDVIQCQKTQSQNSSLYFQQLVSYQNSEEINRNKVTTLRRLSQFYREQAGNAANEREERQLNIMAARNYNKLLKILPQEVTFQKEPVYPADVSVELADTFNDLGEYDKAAKLYESAAGIYREQKDFARQILTLKKWSDAALRKTNYIEAIKQLERAILIQENEMKLSPVNDEIAESYTDLANLYDNRPTQTRLSWDTSYIAKYNNLSRILNNLSFKDAKSNNLKSGDYFILVDDFEKLAKAYSEVGKCDRAEQVYVYARNIFQESHITSIGELHFMSKLGQFRHQVRRDNKEAKIKFDEFVDAFEEFHRDASGDNTGGDKYEAAADFYFEQGDYDKAKRFYEQAQRANQSLLNQYLASQVDVKGKDRIYSLKQIQVTVKKAAVLEKINTKESLRQAEAELLRLLEKKSNPNFEPDSNERPLINVYLADFYDRRGDKEKAQVFYFKALNFNGETITEFAINARAVKKFGDFSQNIGARHYTDALSRNTRAEKQIPDSLKDAPEKEYSRYSKNGKLTIEFYIDKAEILEAWSKIKGIPDADAERLKAEAQEAREKIEEMKAEKETSLCK